MKTGPKPRPLADRFWEKVNVRDPDECWPWKASRRTAGYGQIGIGTSRNPDVRSAHRVSDWARLALLDAAERQK